MSLNDEQRAYVAALDKLPMDQRCWCGWYALGGCYSCRYANPGKSRADYLAAACPECFTLPPHHIKGCAKEGSP